MGPPVRIDPDTVRDHERMFTGGFYAEVELVETGDGSISARIMSVLVVFPLPCSADEDEHEVMRVGPERLHQVGPEEGVLLIARQANVAASKGRACHRAPVREVRPCLSKRSPEQWPRPLRRAEGVWGWAMVDSNHRHLACKASALGH